MALRLIIVFALGFAPDAISFSPVLLLRVNEHKVCKRVASTGYYERGGAGVFPLQAQAAAANCCGAFLAWRTLSAPLTPTFRIYRVSRFGFPALCSVVFPPPAGVACVARGACAGRPRVGLFSGLRRP